MILWIRWTAWSAACLAALALPTPGVLGQAGTEAEAEGWKLEFSDDFDRAQLGPNWQPVRGTWALDDGMLAADSSAHIGCNWRFTGDVRLEYDAVTNAEEPCDLSGVLSAKLGEETSGYYFGFGGQGNALSFLIARGGIVEIGRAHV